MFPRTKNRNEGTFAKPTILQNHPLVPLAMGAKTYRAIFVSSVPVSSEENEGALGNRGGVLQTEGPKPLLGRGLMFCPLLSFHPPLLGHTPTGSCSRKGVLLPSRCLLESPFLEPLLRTLLRTLLPTKTHCKTPSKNPS